MGQKGLICEIYKPSFGDCSNGGISSYCKNVTLVGDKIDRIFDVKDDRPAVRIFEEYPCGELYLRAFLVDENGEKKKGWAMFGGCFIYTSDSRFPATYPVPLFDRYE